MKKLQKSSTSATCIDRDTIVEKNSRKGKIFPMEETDSTPLLSGSVSAEDMESQQSEAPDGSSPPVLEDNDTTALFSDSVSTQETDNPQTEASDGSSPRGVLEDTTRSLESETSSPKASTSGSEAPVVESPTVQWRGFFRLWRQRSMRHLLTFPSLGGLKFSRSNGKSARGKRASRIDLFVDADLCCLKPSWKNFTMDELRSATKNFSSDNLIGKGGYGDVYKGRLKDGQLVAIKRLSRGSTEERIDDFLSELGIIVHINHRNAAKLIGFGIEGGMHLVLQLSPNGSLASLLHGSKEKLDWSVRYKVAVGTAEGLRYLHEICQRRIIHRDIKAANILLTKDFEPQICDFGLAKWLPDNWTHHSMPDFEGTFGYVAPECLMHGIVDEKTDVYAFGVLLLEIITGRQALDSSQQSLLKWAAPLLEKNDIRQLVDPSLAGAYDSQQMDRVALAASLCIQHSAILRPQMSQACCDTKTILIAILYNELFEMLSRKIKYYYLNAEDPFRSLVFCTDPHARLFSF
ncbi:receptor-like cytosolic serine/threonine-protein kinase RBK2 isoform X1 [Magnolia sinica]|uniref:receptor-like cytosolic serine/threonine-protein kinase RBK2 isoform X1 n=1 Tax=Magnolia sinica TaxID=86752 RepID=UPI00265B24EB|nr:receptor-like cytosolic serine/threonine-protein kinase RBK2 isoform X1 [Magnolia sinica]